MNIEIGGLWHKSDLKRFFWKNPHDKYKYGNRKVTGQGQGTS